MKKIKLFAGTAILGMSLITSHSAFGLQLTATTPSGGWSESEGYYTNSYQNRGIQAAAASSPETHYGERQNKVVDNAGTTGHQAYGYTKWSGKYHYTTARMEKSNGTVLKTSGRVAGWDRTDAYSGWYYTGDISLQNLEARTYWGSEF